MSEVRQEGWDWGECEIIASRRNSRFKDARMKGVVRDGTGEAAGTKAWVKMLLLTLRATGDTTGLSAREECVRVCV